MSIFDAIELKKVSKDDVDFLYQMLKERDETVNVTHHKMPTYEMMDCILFCWNLKKLVIFR